MAEDAGSEMKARLRADLRSAMKERRAVEAKVIRALVAAIDNAEAPSIEGGSGAVIQHDFGSRSAEVDRLLLTASHVRRVLLAEINERESAIAELERRGKADRADGLRAEVQFALRYIE